MKKINVIYYSLTALESQTEAREKEEGGELQGAIYVHRTVSHVTQVVMHPCGIDEAHEGVELKL